MTREEPPSREELASLLPSPGEPALPSGRLLAMEEHLMSEMTGSREEEPLWRRRLVLVAVPLATAALVIGVATVVGTDDDGGSVVQPAATSGALDRLAQVAAAAPEWEVGADQFVYTAREVTVDFGGVPNNGDNVPKDVDHGPYESRQWFSPDGAGGWYWDSDAAPDGVPIIVPPEAYEDTREESLGGDSGVEAEENEEVTTADLVFPPQGRHYEDSYPFGVGGSEPANLHNPSWEYVQSLPADPAALLEMVYDENGPNDSEDQADQWAFETLGELFEQTPLPPGVAAGGLRAFAEIPGVTVGTGTDCAGREGVMLSRFAEDLGYRMDLIFDEESAEYLGTRVEQVDESEVYPTGVIVDSAVTERAVVDEERQVPGA